MSPVYDAPRKSGPWVYLAYGCGGCLVLAILAVVVSGMVMRHLMKRTFSTMMNSAVSTTTPAHTGPFKFRYSADASNCVVTLPGSAGAFTYMQVLGSGSAAQYDGGQRALRLNTPKHKNIELPLIMLASPAVRVGVYWYPSKKGRHSYVRLYDSSGDSLVDLDRGKSMMVISVKTTKFAGDLEDSENFSSSTSETPVGNLDATINGKPASEITSIIGKDKGMYLGSIVRMGKKLTFMRAH